MSGNAATTAKRAGLARRLGLDRNPLRRRIDRLQAALMAGLLAAFLAGAPLLTIAAAGWVHAVGTRERHAQRSWHQVPVVLAQAAPRQATFRHWSPPALVRAWWTPPGGPARSAEVPATPGGRAGNTVRVWAGRSGPPASGPLTGDELTARVIATGILVPAALAVIMLGLAVAARQLLDRRRLAAWEADWTTVAPRWTRNR